MYGLAHERFDDGDRPERVDKNVVCLSCVISAAIFKVPKQTIFLHQYERQTFFSPSIANQTFFFQRSEKQTIFFENEHYLTLKLTCNT